MQAFKIIIACLGAETESNVSTIYFKKNYPNGLL
jgi:hypothetical protein